MKIRSIKDKILLIMIPLAVVPVLLIGIAGILYFMNVTHNQILDDNLAQAKLVSLYMDDYLNSSTTFMDALASRPYLISEMAEHKYDVAETTVKDARVKGNFEIAYITDANGTIVAGYPDTAIRVGSNYSGRHFVSTVLATRKPYTGGPFRNVTGNPTIYMSAPIVDNSERLLGVIVGQVDPDTIAKKFLQTQVKNAQYIYMVNNSGIIIIHSNGSFMDDMADFSSVPTVKDVLEGKTGVKEVYNPIEHETRLIAYAPVPVTGWGVVVSLPESVAYWPIYNSAIAFAILTALAAIIAGVIALFLGRTIADPIVSVSTATKKMTDGGDFHRFLPLGRNDEIGDLARSFDDMSHRISADKERIMEEKNRTELYVDIMGHDINNLNQSAMGNLELIEDDQNLTDDQRKSVRDALTAVRGSAGIIDNVRKIQRINDEQIDIVPEDLNTLLEACIRDTPRPQGKKVVINYVPKPGLLVRGNPLLKEAFCNIIGNAIKYSGDEVTIDIKVDRIDRAAGQVYEVVIEDNGHGIPDDVKPKLFRRFQRGTTKAHGKGLGLYIVRSLVEKLGGSVLVEDRVQGDHSKGARFVVTLPAFEGGEVDR
jgi:signal transduction histidine kinase